MSWASAMKKAAKAVAPAFATNSPDVRPAPLHTPDWDRLVSLDFETFYDANYTLSKLSTSEYVRDPRFEALMVGVKIGNKKTRLVPKTKIKEELAKINWKTHSLLCHNTAFDGLILSHHYGIVPKHYYCSLSMARGLHSNEIGAGLDEVSMFYGGHGKIEGGVENMKGVTFKDLYANKPLWTRSAEYCVNDVDEMYRVFCEMLKVYPADEIDLINMTVRMFCNPVLRVDLPRVQAEYAREVATREELFLGVLSDVRKYDNKETLKTPAERALTGKDRDMLIVSRVIGSNAKYIKLFEEAGLSEDLLPRKISKAFMKLSAEEKATATPDVKYSYAFAKDDLDFLSLPDRVWELSPDLDPERTEDVIRADARSLRWQELIDVRLAVKSTTNITRAGRFLEAGKNGMRLPVGYSYYRAHTGRWGGNNKMNMQNLTRGGELRLSILAAPGHAIAVADSGQIEARVNAWLWDQHDLIEAFRAQRDIYSEFASDVFGRPITKEDKMDRHVGKVCVLGLGFQMGAEKFQMTLARGALGGPKIVISLSEARRIVNLYRSKNFKVTAGWKRCAEWIEHMATPGLQPLHYKGLVIGHECIRLPNGMYLKYPHLKKARSEKGWDEWAYQSGPIRKKIYGGLLTENLVQALARIIVAGQMLEIDKKYPIVMTTHDEAVAHPKVAQAQKCYEYMERCMTTSPWWCPEIPLAAEGGWALNYSK